MKKIKNFLGAVLGLAVLAASMLTPGAALAAETRNRFPTDQGRAHENLSFYGMKPKRIVASATGTLLVTGEGFLDGICSFGGVAGAYSLALDSGEGASGLTIHSHSLALAGPVFTATVAESGSISLGDGVGCWFPKPGPIKFVNGLVGINSAAAATSVFYVHPSSGLNPWAP